MNLKKRWIGGGAAALALAGTALLASPGTALASHAYKIHFDVYAYDSAGHMTAHGWGDAVQSPSNGEVTLNNVGIKDDKSDGYGAVLEVTNPGGGYYDLFNRDGYGTITRDNGANIGPYTHFKAKACRLSGGKFVGCGAVKTIQF